MTAIVPHAQSEFDDFLYGFIKSLEASVPRIYSDPIGVPTLGVGYALAVRQSNGTFARRNNLQQDLTNIDISLSAADLARLDDVIDILNDTTLTPVERAAAAGDIIPSWQGPNEDSAALNVFDFDLLGDIQIRALFNVSIAEMKAVVKTRLGDALYDRLNGSLEMAALLSLAFTNPDLIGPKLTAALQTDDRAEAWYEIRYDSNADGQHANRRYKESDLFGLYNDITQVSVDEAKSVLQTYTLHRGTIQTYEDLFNPTNPDASSLRITDKLVFADRILIDTYVTQKNLGVQIDEAQGRVLVGIDGNDTTTLNGSGQNDLIFGEGGQDILNGGAGADVLYGGNGSDTLNGNSGNDILFGGDGEEDRLNGGADDDICRGGMMKTISHSFFFSVVAVASAAFTYPTHAGHYELIRGKGVEVCEMYQKNLNSIDSPQPMICERKINPVYPVFKRPEWKELDLMEDKRLLNSIIKYLDYGDQNKKVDWLDDPRQFRNSLASFTKLHTMEISEAKADINNDGKLESVIKYKNGICGFGKQGYSTALLTLTDTRTGVDPAKSVLLLQNLSTNRKTKKLESRPFEYLYNMYDIFSYKGVSYFDKWSARQAQEDLLSVYQIQNGKTQQVCQFKFIGQ